jgi:hypothetical protein
MCLRLVCKHFDKHIRRLVFGQGLIDPWKCHLSRRFDFLPFPQYLFERCRIRNAGNKDDLIIFLKKLIREVTLELNVNSEEEELRITKAVCHTAAMAVEGIGRGTAEENARKYMNRCRMPSPVAAALGLKDYITDFEDLQLDGGHEMFSTPFEAVASFGRHDMVPILWEKIRFTNFKWWHKYVRLAVWGEHCETVREFIRVMPADPDEWNSQVYKVLCDAIHARRPRVFEMLFGMLDSKMIWGTQKLKEILDLAIAHNSHEILRFMINQPELDPKTHASHCAMPCWECQAIGNLIFRATRHSNDEPLHIILDRGYHPDILPTGRRATSDDLYCLASDLAERRSTVLLLHDHGADLTLNLDAKFQNMVLRRQVRMIKLYGRIRDHTFSQGCFDRALELAQSSDLKQVARALLSAGADPMGAMFMTLEKWEMGYHAIVDDADAWSESRDNARRLRGRSSGVKPGSWEWWRAVDASIAYVKWMKMVAFPWTGEL